MPIAIYRMGPSFDLSGSAVYRWNAAENLSQERPCQAALIDTRVARVILLRRFTRCGLA
jgi:hypothetical protein